MIRRWIPPGLYIMITASKSADYCGNMMLDQSGLSTMFARNVVALLHVIGMTVEEHDGYRKGDMGG